MRRSSLGALALWPMLLQPAEGIGYLTGDIIERATGEVEQVHSGELAHPGELAAGIVAGAALHRLDVTGEELLEAEGLTSGSTSTGRLRLTYLLAYSLDEHLLHTGVDPPVELLTLPHEPDEQRGLPPLVRPQLGGLLRLIPRPRMGKLPGVEQLQRTDNPLAVVGIDSLRSPGGALGKGGVQRGRAVEL